MHLCTMFRCRVVLQLLLSFIITTVQDLAHYRLFICRVSCSSRLLGVYTTTHTYIRAYAHQEIAIDIEVQTHAHHLCLRFSVSLVFGVDINMYLWRCRCWQLPVSTVFWRWKDSVFDWHFVQSIVTIVDYDRGNISSTHTYHSSSLSFVSFEREEVASMQTSHTSDDFVFFYLSSWSNAVRVNELELFVQLLAANQWLFLHTNRKHVHICSLLFFVVFEHLCVSGNLETSTESRSPAKFEKKSETWRNIADITVNFCGYENSKWSIMGNIDMYCRVWDFCFVLFYEYDSMIKNKISGS